MTRAPDRVARQPAPQGAGVRDGVPRPDDHSFDAFYRAQSDRVYRALLLTLGDPYLAREAADEAMARACARWHTVGGLDNPGGWAYRVGLNWATSWWRKLRRERPLEPDWGVGTVPDPQVTVALDALRELPLPQRAVVVCRVLLDLSTAETAALLGLAEGTVKSRLARALAALRAVLSDQGEA
ncbi:RNA polymerase sigma factor [Rugosimonospora africana]|uniref:DNA-directed RNA polymerase sigma-70 factor n=1 Tax=Rugosimonospora africana TaxID=556532 RepID=A0A8J3QM71_9ACTN|nr:sigma factor-like helix-turn-helix DNA-binding protein [Rugosimonospora africana]GIH13605.1 DNA-directed RNA polymerase sigma-70 factor [Rugosimonospora africana]